MKLTYLKSLSFWESLDNTEKEMMIKNTYEKEYEAGEVVFSPGENCLGVIIVTSGILRSFVVSEDGKRATVLRLREGEVCVSTMSCLLAEIDYNLMFEAECKASVLIVPASTFKMLFDKNIYIENFAYKIVTQRTSYIMNAVEQLMFKSLEQRVITFLLDESNATKSDKLSITKIQLAENIGSAREAVSRILTKLSKDKLVSVSRGEIVLLDKPALYSKT